MNAGEIQKKEFICPMLINKSSGILTRGFYAAKVLSVGIHKIIYLNERVKIWAKFNDYPVAWSTLEDILVEVGEHLTSKRVW